MATDAQSFFDVTKLLKEFDPGKVVAEFSNALKQYKLSGVDLDSLVASQKKNLEALTSANRVAFEGRRSAVEGGLAAGNRRAASGTDEERLRARARQHARARRDGQQGQSGSQQRRQLAHFRQSRRDQGLCAEAEAAGRVGPTSRPPRRPPDRRPLRAAARSAIARPGPAHDDFDDFARVDIASA